MDIEKIKKINELSKKLRNHSFFSNSQDSISKEQEIFNKKDSSEMSENNTRKNHYINQPINVPLLEKKFQILLDQNIKSFKEDLTNLQDTVEFLQKELSKLHQRVNKLQNNTVITQEEKPTSKLSKLRELQKEQQAQESEKIESIEEKNNETNPKPGSLTSNDVSIEKFFYYGDNN